MGRPSFATPGGVKSGGFSFKGGSAPTCPLNKKNVKPSDDKCRCCSGDTVYEGTTLSFGSMFNIAVPASIRLI
jgi:hypothetical protein